MSPACLVTDGRIHLWDRSPTVFCAIATAIACYRVTSCQAVVATVLTIRPETSVRFVQMVSMVTLPLDRQVDWIFLRICHFSCS